MKKNSIALLVSALFAITACSPDQNKAAASASNTTSNSTYAASTTNGDILATVNGKPILNAQSRVIQSLTQEANPGAQIDVEKLNENIITQEILVQEALRLGLDQKEEYKIQADFSAKALLTNALYKDFVAKNPATDAEITAEYANIKAQFEASQSSAGTEYIARHILVESEADAKKIIAQLASGGDFAKLASEHSIDVVSAKDGGLLGDWTSASLYVPEFANALSSLKKGESSKAPVKSQFGWHIIHVDDVRTVASTAEEFPAINDHIKDQLREQITERKFYEYQTKLVESADVKMGS